MYGDSEIAKVIGVPEDQIYTLFGVAKVIDQLPVDGKEEDNITTCKNIMMSYMARLYKSDAMQLITYNMQKHFNLSNKAVKILIAFNGEIAKALSSKKKNVIEQLKEQGKEEAKKERETDRDEAGISEERQNAAKDKAIEILSAGNPVRFILDTVKKTHVGDEPLEEACCLSIASQSCTNTDGIQIGSNGDPGSGKSHGMKAHLHLVRRKHKIQSTLSAKALYYANIKPGMIVFSDDTTPGEDLEQTIKRATTNFQEETFHMSVKDQEGIELIIPERIIWWLNSVESEGSTQLLSRQYKYNTLSTQSHKDDITVKQLTDAQTGDHGLTDVTDDVLVCRYIYDEIKSQLIRVIIPYAKCIQVHDNRDNRTLNMFLDMIKGYAVINFMQRDRDENGFVIAAKEDFDCAKKLFESQKEASISKYTEREAKIIKCVLTKHRATAQDIALDTGIPYSTVNRIINGNSKSHNGGLLEKVKGLTILKESVSEGEIGYKVTKNYVYYCLDKLDNCWDLFEEGIATLWDCEVV
jgi:hypothetical protein